MTSLKNLVFLTVPSILLCILCGELFFRFVIPAAETPWGYYDPIDQIARFEIGQRAGMYTTGKFAQQRGRWRINNMGWNSDIDYLTSDRRSRPLIAIIGDSYIEALQVDIKNSIVSILREKVSDQYDVYGFGMSGASLAQYLQMSRYVNKYFSPNVLVINVVHNDFDESLTSIANYPYFLGIEITDSGPKEAALPLIQIKAKRTTKIAFESAIFRYLWNNLEFNMRLLKWGFRQDENLAKQKKENDGYLYPEHVDNIKNIEEAVKYILLKMKEENPKSKLIFMIDAPRSDIYKNNIHHSKVLWMNKLLENLCTNYNILFIDLTEPFYEKYKKDKIRFSSMSDYHWNEEGHKYAAEVLYKHLLKFDILKGDKVYSSRYR